MQIMYLSYLRFIMSRGLKEHNKSQLCLMEKQNYSKQNLDE
uniref:Uncharacterized protein n=1 Tax=Rhizophora mucronata TaxID=61149 RepID=A0A2P2PA33_RHIMU